MNDTTPYLWTPPPELVARSNLTAFLLTTGRQDYDDLASKAEADPAWLMQEVFRFCDVRFYRSCDQILDVSRGQAWARWCVGGTTNIVLNCLDKHRGTAVWDQTFLVWEGEDKAERRSLKYHEFERDVARLAQGLRDVGIGRGDVVAIYMPNLPETFAAFFAILKLGAIVMPLFSGFGPAPIQTRLNHGGAKAVITADGTWRRGVPAPLKSVLDAALEGVPTVQHVIVTRRHGLAIDTPMQKGRDLWWDDVVAGKDSAIATVEMQAEDPAILLYTSGTTGEPKGCIWTHIGFIGSMVTRDMIICGDFKSSDRFFFFSDMGWMVGAMCACIPSFAGGSLLIAEGTPDYPDTGRFWRLIADHQVTYLGVSPTIVRSLMRYGLEVNDHDLSSLRMTASGGEAWTAAPWLWFFEHVCKKKIPIINISGGTEVGGCIFTGTPNHPMNPGSFSRPALGVGADIVDMTGKRVPDGTVGELVLRHSSIGLTKSSLEGRCALYRELLEHTARAVGAWRLRDARAGRALLHPRPVRRHHQDFRQAHRPGRARGHSDRNRQAGGSRRVRHSTSRQGLRDRLRLRADAGCRGRSQPRGPAVVGHRHGNGHVLSPRDHSVCR